MSECVLRLFSSMSFIVTGLMFRSLIHFEFTFVSEKAMSLQSSTLAWKIPWTEKPGGLPSMGLHRIGHD